MSLRGAPRAILLGGLLAAAGDIAYAFGFYALRGIPPLRILQSIASGLLGRAAYGGGAATGALGLALHVIIGLGAASTFWFASRRFPWLVRHAIPSGIVFGLGVYAVMNYVVIPLSAFPHPRRFDPLVVGTGLLVHMFLIGLPIALCARAADAQGARRRSR